MAELKLDQLSLKSQKSPFGPIIVAEANALSRKRPSESLGALEAHARDRVAFGEISKRLRKETDTDPLTGALSRKAIFRGIREGLAEADRKGGVIQVLFMDVKQFKQFNDRFGHKTGDEALKFFVQISKKHIRPYDEIGRYGGDEFIVLRKNGPLNATRLVRELENSFDQLDTPYNSIAATVGVADYHKEMGPITAEQLVNRADQAFYYAKNHHIDVPVVWEPSMASIVVEK
jgi:two-component system cell cycle response regulator